MVVEPVAGAPAAVADCGDERALVIADYHAGIESELRQDGVELASQASERVESVLRLIDETDPDRLVVLGDLGQAIGEPWYDEREEFEDLLTRVCERVPVTLVKGNHDGDVETLVDDLGLEIDVTPTHGVRLGDVGFAHGHTWPSPEVLTADVVCVGHEHPEVRLEDEVGGYRLERVWLRGDLAPGPFRVHESDPDLTPTGELVVFPAFNALSGGTWINVADQEFLSPFLPDGLVDGQAYLLDGTRLGRYDEI
jgi:putative SbcD/Mre11-related phosphoesterase